MSEQSTLVAATPKQVPVSEIPVAQIRPTAHQARKNFDETLLNVLAQSLKEEGLLQPILVRESPLGSGSYELIAGERRWRAAKLLGWETIEAKVIRTVSEGEAAIKGLVENLQREDLNPLEEAQGFSDILDLHDNHWTQDKIAEVVGRSRSYVTQSLGMLKVSPEAQDYVRRLTLSRSHLLEIMRLPAAKQVEGAKKAADGGLSIKETRKLVDGMIGKKGKEKKHSGARGGPKATGFVVSQDDGYWHISGIFLTKTPMELMVGALQSACLEWEQKQSGGGEGLEAVIPSNLKEILSSIK